MNIRMNRSINKHKFSRVLGGFLSFILSLTSSLCKCFFLVYIYMCMCVCVCVCAYVYMHTYTFIFSRAKITPQDTGREKKIKAKLNLTKLKAQVELLEDRTTHYTTKYIEIDQEVLTEIKELCQQQQHNNSY